MSETRFREKFGAVELLWAQNQLGTLETERAEAVRLGDVLERLRPRMVPAYLNALEDIEKALGGPDALVVKPRVDDA